MKGRKNGHGIRGKRIGGRGDRSSERCEGARVLVYSDL